jgi:hypothetical protein
MTRTAPIVAALLLVPALDLGAAESANYTNALYTFSNGGGAAASASYKTDACIGQPAIGLTVDTVNSNKTSVSYFAPVFFGTDFHLTLANGYNLISLPLLPDKALTAESLGQLIGGQGGECTTVIAYDAVTKGFVTHPVGTSVLNFAVGVGSGYFIRCTKASTLTVTGFAFCRSTATLGLKEGYNLVGLPLSPVNEYRAERAGAEISAAGGMAQQVVGYEGAAFVTHPIGTSVDNFKLELGRGYFVRTGADVTWPLKQ